MKTVQLAPDFSDTLHTKDNNTLHYVEWRPLEDRIVGKILLIHGYGEHIRRYDHWARRFTEAGYLVAGFDLRGMGRSSGVRGLVYDFKEYVHDVEMVWEYLHSRFDEDSPGFIYGHSMGGLVTLLHAQQNQFAKPDGYILSGPMLGVALPTPKWKVTLGKALVRVAPRFRMPQTIPAKYLTSDQEQRANHRTDPLILKDLPIVWYFAALRAMEQGKIETHNVVMPTLWLIPGNDNVCSAEAAKEAFHRLPKTAEHCWNEFPEMLHELHHEPEEARQQVFQNIIEWLQQGFH